MIFNVTGRACDKINSLAKEKHPTDIFYLRISVVGGGCSGLSYKMDWDHNIPGDEFCLPIGNAEIVIDKKSALFLNGVLLDYTDGLNGKGFEWINPNATRSCGCGSSFST